MGAMEAEYHLTFKQVAVRILSVLVCGIGAAGCAYSLSLQVQEVGTMMASLTWFSSLGAAVLAIAGYASTCDPGRGKSRVAAAVVVIALVGAVGVVLEKVYLYDMEVIELSVVAGLFQTVVLVVYHFLLKREDPDAA